MHVNITACGILRNPHEKRPHESMYTSIQHIIHHSINMCDSPLHRCSDVCNTRLTFVCVVHTAFSSRSVLELKYQLRSSLPDMVDMIMTCMMTRIYA